MIKILKIIGFMLSDFFTSGFMKVIYKIVGVLVLLWALFIPATMFYDNVSIKTEFLSFIYDQDDGTNATPLLEQLNKNSYVELFKFTIESPANFLLTCIGNIILLVAVFMPLIYLIFFLAGLCILFLGIKISIEFILDLPSNIRDYFKELNKRISKENKK